MKVSKIRFILILGILLGFAGIFAVKKSGVMQNSNGNLTHFRQIKKGSIIALES